MLVSLTVGKVDAGVTALLTPDKRLIEFPSILLPPNISCGSIVDITVSQNTSKEAAEEQKFRALQERIFSSFGASEPATPALRCRNATQTSVVLEWDPVELATADLISLSLYRNGQKAGNIPRPLQMHSTKISGLAVDTEYSFHLVLRTSAGTRMSEKVTVRTHKMTDLSGITITTGILPSAAREKLALAVERIGAKMVDGVRIDTTHFVTTEGRGAAWEKAVEGNIPVVRPEWVEACETNGRILGVTKFYLDAMRPGLPSEEHIAPAVPPKGPPALPPKDEVASPPQPVQERRTPVASGGGDGDSRRSTDDDDNGDGDGDGDDGGHEADDDKAADEQHVESEQEAKEASADEQKMRQQDRAEHEVALRPWEGKSVANGTATYTREAAAESEEEEEERPSKPAAATPDAASFQEVEL